MEQLIRLCVGGLFVHVPRLHLSELGMVSRHGHVEGTLPYKRPRGPGLLRLSFRVERPGPTTPLSSQWSALHLSSSSEVLLLLQSTSTATLSGSRLAMP